MDIKKFKAGKLVSQGWYKSFQPASINRDWNVSTPELNSLLERANLKLGALDAYSQLVPDVDTYICMHIIKEATTSSRIEGTRTNIEDAVMKKSEVSPEKRDDWQEVNNYIKAMNYALKELDKLPISGRLLKQTHAILLQGARGKQKMSGEYRTSQNWIGGVTINDAVYVPPEHSSLSDLMSDLEKFLNDKMISTPHLIRIAMAHYQFETIHPFLDGNGRLGRLLITLYLVSKSILTLPTLYLSDFFERNRQLYYDNLRKVSDKNDMVQWLKFFLVGIIEMSDKASSTFQKIIKLREDIERKRLPAMGRRHKIGVSLLLYLYKKPILTVADVTKALEVTKPTANTLVKEFQKAKILKEKTGYSRNRVFYFDEYLKLFS